jgi:hypothetical protein
MHLKLRCGYTQPLHQTVLFLSYAKTIGGV